MPIIYQLLKTLSPTEIEQVNALPFQDRERDVLQVMLQMTNKIFPSSTVCKKLNITTSHLDKINSILFKKVIESLAGHDVYNQINYLDQKNGLWKASLRTLKHHEHKVIELSNDKPAKFEFYKFYFEWLLFNTAAQNIESDVKRVYDEVLNNCPKATYDETQLWLKISLFRKEINISTTKADFTSEEKQKLLFTQLNQLITEAKAIDSAVCLYKAKLCGIFLNNLLKNFSQSRIYISNINDLFIAYKEAFTETEILTAQWHYAQILFFNSEFEEAFNIYHGLYGRINKNEPLRWYIYIAEYFQMCLVMEQYEIATTLCETYFSKFYRDSNGNFYLSALIQCVKLLIHTGQFEEAKVRLEELHRLTTKTSSLQFQFALRELTAALHYLTKDYKMALTLAEKNLKFMRSKKMHVLIPEYTFHSRLIKVIIKNKQKNKGFDDEEQMMFDAMQKSTLAQYGHLLKRLITQ
jgi:hypothetical protein